MTREANQIPIWFTVSVLSHTHFTKRALPIRLKAESTQYYGTLYPPAAVLVPDQLPHPPGRNWCPSSAQPHVSPPRWAPEPLAWEPLATRPAAARRPHGTAGPQMGAQPLTGVQPGDCLPETDRTYSGSAMGELVKKVRTVLPSLVSKIQVKQTGNEPKGIRNCGFPS